MGSLLGRKTDASGAGPSPQRDASPASGAAAARGLELPVALASASFAFLNFSLPLRVEAMVGAGDGGGIAVGALYAVFTGVLLVGRPLVGWALDRFGRRPFLVAALVAYVVVLAGYAVADGFWTLLAARAGQGAAAALLWTSVRTWVADVTPGASRGEALGRVTERSVRGSIVGAGVAFAGIGVLGVVDGWRLAFGLYAICALLALALLLRRLPRAVSGAGGRDADGADGADGADARPGPGLDPMLVAVAASAATSVAVFPFVVLGLAEHFGDDAARIAFWMLPVAVVMGFLPSRAGRLVDRHGARRVVPPALALAALASLGLAIAAAPWASILALAAVTAGTAAADTAFAARAGGGSAARRGRRYGHFELAAGLGGVAGPLAAGLARDTLGVVGPACVAALAASVALAVAVRVLRRPVERDPSP